MLALHRGLLPARRGVDAVLALPHAFEALDFALRGGAFPLVSQLLAPVGRFLTQPC